MQFDVTTPPATNNLYATFGKRRIKTKKYREWIRGELMALVAQRVRPVELPVSINVLLPATIRGDADGRLKPLVDLCVRAGIIPDDSKKYVRSISIGFHGATHTRVQVEPYRPIIEKAAA